MRRILNLITRRSNTPSVPDNAEVIFKNGGKIGSGAVVAGAAIYSNSQNVDGEVKKIGDKTAEEACDYSSQFIA